MFVTSREKLLYWGLFFDLFSLNMAFLLAFVIRFGSIVGVLHVELYRTLLLIINLLYLLVFLARRKPPHIIKRDVVDTRLREARVLYMSFGVVYLAIMVFLRGYEYSRMFHILFLLLFALLFILQRDFVQTAIWDRLVARGRKIRVVLVGAGETGRMYLERIQQLSDFYDLVGVLDDDPANAVFFNGQFKGNVSRLGEVLDSEKVDEVVISTPPDEAIDFEEVVRATDKHYAQIKVIPAYHRDLSLRNLRAEEVSGLWLFSMSNSNLSVTLYQFWKRAFDIVFSAFALVVVFPFLYLFSMPAIKLATKGSVFFKQKRKGYRGEEFTCWKLRTMRVLKNGEEVQQAKPDDPRKTKIGHFLRKTNLDEFPQFWNVLKGEMSVVGPRPHMVEHDRMYSQLIDKYYARLYAKPGLTGWAQINGYRGATYDHELMRKRVEHDIWYIEHWSFWLDMKIILMTVVRMIKGDPEAY